MSTGEVHRTPAEEGGRRLHARFGLEEGVAEAAHSG
jgi:hypothetical protein